MNEWFKKVLGAIKEKWAKWTVLQKGIGIGIAVIAVVAIILMFSFSSKDSTVRLFNAPIDDQTLRDNISYRLDELNVHYFFDAQNYVHVDDQKIARKLRPQLVAEGLRPARTDPFSLFDVQNWSKNNFNDKVNWQRAMQESLRQNLVALDYIQNAEVRLTLPEESTFASTQKPTTASITLWKQQGAEELTKKQIRGIQDIVKFSVEGLTDENITIIDGVTSLKMNDFEGMEEFDKINETNKRMDLVSKKENEYAELILQALQGTFSANRVRKVNLKIDMDMDEKNESSHEYYGITIKPRTPGLAYDDSVVVETLPLATEEVDKKFTGTGFNPEGPAGVEGQNPPVYSDMSNVIGESTEKGKKQNNALNERTSTISKKPVNFGRATVSVNIDGTWEEVKDDKGNLKIKDGKIERIYTPLTPQNIEDAKKIIAGVIGKDDNRGDFIEVTNIAFDRTEEFRARDEEYFARLRRNQTIMFSLIGVAVVLIAFILFRIISRYIERQRHLKEEALLREQEEKRRQALWEAQQQGMEVTMSVEERHRAELQENAIAMAKEHPEDVAMLIRTWLMEE